MIQYLSPIRSLAAFFRAVCWVPLRSSDRSEAGQPIERREPSRENILRSITARRPKQSRFATASLGYLRLDGCDH